MCHCNVTSQVLCFAEVPAPESIGTEAVTTQLWVFVEYLNPAHTHRRGVAAWNSPVIPAWPHVTTVTVDSQRYDFVLATAVEGVHMLAPDVNNSQSYYAVPDTDRALWHER